MIRPARARLQRFAFCGSWLLAGALVPTRAQPHYVAPDLGGLAEGQMAGLCHFSRDASTLGVRRRAGVTMLEFTHDAKRLAGPAIASARLWLRSAWGLDGRSEFFYSLDGRDFLPFGEPYQLGWGHYRGDRIGLYTFNNDGEAGFVDVDSFEYRYDSPTSK